MRRWSIKWTETAARDLARLDPPVARRILEKLERSSGDPARFSSRLVASDDCKLRIGGYRLLAVLDPRDRSIGVERVDHRSRVYR